MKIDNLKDLQRLIQLCRKLGVDAIEVDNVKMNLGSKPERIRTSTASKVHSTQSTVYAPGGITEDTEVPSLTNDQLLFWSAQGHDEIQEPNQ